VGDSSRSRPGLTPVGQAPPGFTRFIATGGIGHGILFSLEGDATLGRNESRLGVLQPGRDYCKLHIIAHYVSVLLGAGSTVEVIPIGRVGTDEAGERLVAEMQSTGMRMEEVRRVPEAATLFSVCFLYPDKSGGNITTALSASSTLAAADVDAALGRYPPAAGGELVLAAPEVPLEARVRLLERGAARGALTAASVLASEAAAFEAAGAFAHTGLLAVNIDEARAIARLPGTDDEPGRIVRACAERLWRLNGTMLIAVTDGANGCWACSAGRILHSPALPVRPLSTAGAGDAFLAGVVSGLWCGLPFLPAEDHGGAPVPLSSAIALGALVAALSTLSPHSIAPEITASEVLRFLHDVGRAATTELLSVFGEVEKGEEQRNAIPLT
jgi:sugar/nucleoside kinase (ribokinase family)